MDAAAGSAVCRRVRAACATQRNTRRSSEESLSPKPCANVRARPGAQNSHSHSAGAAPAATCAYLMPGGLAKSRCIPPTMSFASRSNAAPIVAVSAASGAHQGWPMRVRDAGRGCAAAARAGGARLVGPAGRLAVSRPLPRHGDHVAARAARHLPLRAAQVRFPPPLASRSACGRPLLSLKGNAHRLLPLLRSAAPRTSTGTRP